ncbi:aldose epimerase family protein [Butyrivibrio sp. NC3005]|uniref:aldose epimerase family protein n=1 Tax=Butyrivibrio sp. NC3005 TaxID=1280685 RepID=UPI00040ABDA6|nr:aldose epimerase family protein [Butyrivibrio sp. NC3005]
MSIKREFMGETKDGAPVYLYHLVNSNDMEVTVLNYGVNLRSIFVKDRDGARRDVLLGYEPFEEYFVNDVFLGASVGPVANRTANAEYEIGGKKCHMSVNENENNLHTDFDNGFHKRIWDAEEKDNSVLFTLKSSDGDLGFTGNRTFTIEVSLSEENEVKLHYHAESDEDTYINMTNHAYFNLGGQDSGSILDHVMQLNASNFTPVQDGKSIPTGEIRSVAGTPMDFTSPKAIGKDIDAEYDQLKFTSGYDHNFIIDGAVNADGTVNTELKSFASVTNPATGITMHCFTTLPGFQFYSGNFLKSNVGKDNVKYVARDGFCLETQYYPNAINTPAFPSPVFGKDKVYDTTTIYQFK